MISARFKYRSKYKNAGEQMAMVICTALVVQVIFQIVLTGITKRKAPNVNTKLSTIIAVVDATKTRNHKYFSCVSFLSLLNNSTLISPAMIIATMLAIFRRGPRESRVLNCSFVAAISGTDGFPIT